MYTLFDSGVVRQELAQSTKLASSELVPARSSLLQNCNGWK